MVSQPKGHSPIRCHELSLLCNVWQELAWNGTEYGSIPTRQTETRLWLDNTTCGGIQQSHKYLILLQLLHYFFLEKDIFIDFKHNTVVASIPDLQSFGGRLQPAVDS